MVRPEHGDSAPAAGSAGLATHTAQTNFRRPPLDYHDLQDPARGLLEYAVTLVNEGIVILERHVTTDEQLCHPSVLIPGGSLGKHFRHVQETFDALLLPLGQSDTADVLCVDYDAELPNTRQSIATSLEDCRHAFAAMREALLALGKVSDLAAELEREVEVVSLTPSRHYMYSTLGRELWFCALHTIHHYTMIRTIACNELGIGLPVEFGTSPATLLFRDKDWKPPEPSTKFIAKL